MWDHLESVVGFMEVRMDLPGHGQSTTKSEAMASMQTMAELVRVTIDHLGIEEYHVVGHSMGGYVGLELMQIDDRCKKLVLMNSNFWSDDRRKQRDRKRVAKIVAANKLLFLYEAIPNLFLDPEKNDEIVQSLIKEAESISAESIADVSIAMSKRNDLSHLAKEEGKRILVVQGAEDAIVPVEKMRELRDSGSFNYIELDDCGHMAHIEQSAKVSKAIRDFLK